MRDTTVASGKEDRDSVCASPLRSVRRHIQFGWALAQIKFGEASAKERMLHLLTKLMSNQLGTLTPPPPRLVDGAAVCPSPVGSSKLQDLMGKPPTRAAPQ